MDENVILNNFISKKGLRHSKQRDVILSVFLEIERHITIEELWKAVKKKYPAIGFATVYRTMKLLCECGLCSEIHLDDGTTRYEHLYNHEHHDHLVCVQCGLFLEVVDKEIEQLQEKLMEHHGFSPRYHRMNLYGVCKECRKK